MRRVQARMAATRRSLAVAFVVSLTLASALGIAVYNLDKTYIASRFDLVSYVPDRLMAGSEASILVMALDNDGTPIPHKAIEIKLESEKSTETIWSGYTDGEGFALPVFTTPIQSGKADIIVVSGSEELKTATVIDDTIRIIITTDKPVYQPGQTIHMRVLSFTGANPLPDSAALILEVIDPNGDKIFKKQMIPDEFGISSYDLALSDQIVQGTYTIKAISGEREVTKAVIVKDYVLPKFSVNLLGMHNWYLVTEKITGVVEAEYFFGKYVEGNIQVNASVYYGVWTPVFSTQGELSPYGEFSFSINPIRYAIGIPAAGGNGYMQLNVSVTDTGGHTETRSKVIPIAPSSVSITVLTDSCVVGQESQFNVVVRTPDGRAMANSTVKMTLKDENGVGVGSMSGVADSRGIVDFAFTYNGEATATFSVGGYYTDTVSINLGDGSGVKVIPDKSSYSIGEVGQFEVVYLGESLTSNVYYDVVSRGFIVDRGVIELSDDRGELTVQMVPEMEPFAQVRVYKIQKDMDVVRDAVTFSVGSGTAMSVSIQSDNSTYSPRDNVTVSIQTALTGQPIQTALGVSIVDEAVFELDSMFQGYEQIIFGLDEEFIEPQYQVLSYVYTSASSLPSASDEVVSELDKGRMDGTWEQNKAEAQALKDDAVRSYWYSMFLVAGIGFIGIGALSVRRFNRAGDYARRRSNGLSNGVRAGLVVMAIVVVGMIVLGGLYVMVLGFGGSSQSEPLIPRNDDDAMWDRMAPAPAGFGFDDIFSGEDQNTEQMGTGDGSTTPLVVRNYFPETWYWNPCLITDENGVANITLTAPDSITSWKADVIASTVDGQIGTGNASITVFQPFFIDPDIPVSVVRGDRFELKVQVYNYLNSTQDVAVTIIEEPWFTLVSNSTQTVRVVANYVSYVTFTIEAGRAGWHTLTFSATSGSAQDAMVKQIRVVPDGTKQETLYNGEVDNASVTKSLLLSPDRIEGGENAWVKLQGGVEAVLLEGVDAFIQFVTGCGEQSLSTLSIDILAYDTVRQLGTAPDKLFEYETMVNQGLQHELTFLVTPANNQGRGIVWFPDMDQDAHPWLSSWGLIAFQDAINAGFGLDENIIKDMQTWLISIQESDGSWIFPDWGIYEFNNPILKSKKIASTAYIARALLYSGIPGTDEHIKKAVDYVEANVGSVMDDPYTLALSILVLQQGGSSTSLRYELASALNELKKSENDTYYWSSNTNMISDNGGEAMAFDMWGGYSSSRVIETTGYAAMALDGEGTYRDVVNGAIKYLLNHRQSLGGWYSTQDTIVAFQTLKAVAEGSTIESVTAKVSVNGAEVFSEEIGEFNKDVTYYVDIRPYLTNSTNVSVQSTGTGTLLYSIYLAQYVPWPDVPDSSPYLTLTVTYDATHIAITDSVTAHMHLLYNGVAPMLKMILVDLRSPMGLSFVLSEFDQLQANGIIASYDSNERQVLVYLVDVVAGTPVEFDYTLVPEMPIKSTVQDISAWDMYDPNNLRTETLPVQFEVT